MFQVKTTNALDGTGKPVWVSPLRDIAHCGLHLINKAFELSIESINESHNNDESIIQGIKKLHKAMEKYVNYSMLPTYTVDRALKESGLLEIDAATAALFNKWLVRVYLCYYFASIREAMHGDTAPMGLVEFKTIMNGIHTSVIRTGSNWFVRKIKQIIARVKEYYGTKRKRGEAAS